MPAVSPLFLFDLPISFSFFNLPIFLPSLTATSYTLKQNRNIGRRPLELLVQPGSMYLRRAGGRRHCWGHAGFLAGPWPSTARTVCNMAPYTEGTALSLPRDQSFFSKYLWSAYMPGPGLGERMGRGPCPPSAYSQVLTQFQIPSSSDSDPTWSEPSLVQMVFWEERLFTVSIS